LQPRFHFKSIAKERSEVVPNLDSFILYPPLLLLVLWLIMMSLPSDENKEIDVGEITESGATRTSAANLEGSLSLLDALYRRDSVSEEFSKDGSNKEDTSSKNNDLVSVSSGSVSSKRLSSSLVGRVSKFNANPNNAMFLSPMQSHRGPIRTSFSTKSPKLLFSPSSHKRSTRKLKNRIENFEGNASSRSSFSFDVRSPEEIRKLVKSSRDSQGMDSIVSRYEHILEEESQQRRELVSKIGARERHRRLGCTKSKEERAQLLKRNRSRFYRSGNEKILDTDISVKTKIGIGGNGIVSDEVRAVPYDFTDFKSPSFLPKSEIQRNLVLGVVERSFVFAEFRKHGKARCDESIDTLVNAFEPVDFSPGHVLKESGMKKENDEFYIVEKGRIDFQKDGTSVAQVAKAGGYFGELSLLYNSTCERMISVYEASKRDARLLKINQKTFRGILNTCAKQAFQEKKDALLGVDFLSNLIDKNENMIRRLSSIMVREEMKVDEIFHLSQDTTFVVIRSGRVHVTNTDETLESGDHFGSRALIRTLPKQGTGETDLVARSETVVFFRIDNHAMRQIVGPSRLQNLMDMQRFASSRLIEKSNLSDDAVELMADTIVEKTIDKDEEHAWEVDKNDPPAVYVVREGSLVVTSKDKKTGDKTETLVTAGNIFGYKQLKLSMKNGTPTYRRLDGLRASIPEGQSTSIGVLPLDEVNPDVKDDVMVPSAAEPSSTDSTIDSGKDKVTSKIKSHHSESSILKLRAKVRDIVKSNISFDDLEKIRLLGEGEFGEVWLVEADVFRDGSSATKQQFALKSQLIFDDSRGVDATEAIFREVDIMKELRHSQLVDLVNTYQDEEHIHMLMRVVPYGELWDRMHTEDDQGNWSSGLPVDHAKFYAISVADTLNYIHSRGIIYRDLKPENILIDVDGYPVLVDFGFTKFCPDKTYTFVGTPNYVAPEIITNAGHNRCVDFWALGVTIYEMVTGENPFFFEGMDPVSLYHSICYEKYFPLKDQSKEFVDLVDNLLQKDPVERLGMLHGGIKDIVQHQWFDGIELAQIQTKAFPAPWKPAEFFEDGFEHLKIEENEQLETRDSLSSQNESPGSLSRASLSFNSSRGSSLKSFASEEFCHERRISSISELGEVPESPGLTEGLIEDECFSPSSQSDSVRGVSLSSTSKSEEVVSPKSKSKKKKTKKTTSRMSSSNHRGSISNAYDNPEAFQYVSTLEEAVPVYRNPKSRRTLVQKKQSRQRRDLLQNSLANLGID
jgi:serine/threonine protein kinase/CRP-like cAMP-binding protein